MWFAEKQQLTSRTGGRIGAGLLVCGLSLVGLTGCPPPLILEPDDIEDPPLDARRLFEKFAEPELTKSCSCHASKADTVDPFLLESDRYTSITTYQNGKFLVNPPESSLLLQKGAHRGPAFATDQAEAVRAWLSSEAAERGKAMGSPTSPTVAIRTGEFYISLEKLTGDPLAKLTFTMDSAGLRSYRITNLKLTAGTLAGIHAKHPRVIIFSATGAAPESSDALSTVDMTAMARMTATVGSGTLLMSNLPATSARLAVAFEVLEKVNPVANPQTDCKNFALYNPKVMTRLANQCATICHSPTATDTARRIGATGAFDMSFTLSQVDTDQKKVCFSTLARINPLDPPKSVLILQATPAASGGTSNHPYKLDTPTRDLPGFVADVSAWATAEK